MFFELWSGHVNKTLETVSSDNNSSSSIERATFLVSRLFLDWISQRSIRWLIDWLIDWLWIESNEWSIDWLIDWLDDWKQPNGFVKPNISTFWPRINTFYVCNWRKLADKMRWTRRRNKSSPQRRWRLRVQWNGQRKWRAVCVGNCNSTTKSFSITTFFQPENKTSTWRSTTKDKRNKGKKHNHIP